jgi:hypothetical protein
MAPHERLDIRCWPRPAETPDLFAVLKEDQKGNAPDAEFLADLWEILRVDLGEAGMGGE